MSSENKKKSFEDLKLYFDEKEEPCFPDYNGNSIVNLMGTILSHYGVNSQYEPLINFPPSELEDFNNIILLIIDGLGYDFIQANGNKSTFQKFLRPKMTSVFPSTTASAITTFYTGVAPHNHGVPAWFTYLRELGVISVILPMEIRGSSYSILNNHVTAKNILQQGSFYDKLNVETHSIMPAHLVGAPYNSEILGNTNQIGFRNLKEFFTSITGVIESSSQPKFICAYWPNFDAKAHGFGINSKKCVKHYAELNREFELFMEKIDDQASQSKIIITADHGLIDSPPEHVIYLEEHPALHSFLTLPLSGEGRCPFFYVRPSRVKQFEEYCSNNLQHAGTLIKSEELIKSNLFGLFEPHPRLFDRIGDYIMLMKEDYVFYDKLLGEQRVPFIGNHGGLSSEEMHVPLIVI